MTTISPNRKRGPQSSRLRAVWIVVLFIIVFGMLVLWREGLASLVWRIGAPLASARNEMAASTGSIFSRFASNAKLAAEVEALRAELASSTVALMDRNLLFAENRELKERFNRPTSSLHTVLATVILRPPAAPYDTFMLDVGSDQGVVEGDLVSAGGSVYIGRISHVYATASRAVLFSAPGEVHDAILLNPKTLAGLPLSVAGQGGASLSGEVPAGAVVSIGDAVLLPNISVEFIARVIAVDSAPEQSFKTLYLQLPVNPLSLRFVEVRRVGNTQ